MGFTVLGTYISAQQLVLFFIVLLILSLIRKPIFRFIAGCVVIWIILGRLGVREQVIVIVQNAFNYLVHFMNGGVY